jgi:methylphosphotriester-DNA--protein-cysteine methyltransferase
MKVRNFILLLLICMAAAVQSGCSDHLKKGDVVVIAKTNTYHREGCPPTNMAKTKIMTIAEAKAENYKPCPGCKPDSTN